MTTSYIDGAQFLRPEQDPEEWQFVRDPGSYDTSNIAWQRMNELEGIIEWDDVRVAIREGNLYAADRGCSAFVHNLGGVVLYVIVQAEIDDYEGLDYDLISAIDFEHTVVSIWPYVYDRDEAWVNGRWSSRQLDKIEEIEPQYSG